MLQTAIPCQANSWNLNDSWHELLLCQQYLAECETKAITCVETDEWPFSAGGEYVQGNATCEFGFVGDGLMRFCKYIGEWDDIIDDCSKISIVDSFYNSSSLTSQWYPWSVSNNNISQSFNVSQSANLLFDTSNNELTPSFDNRSVSFVRSQALISYPFKLSATMRNVSGECNNWAISIGEGFKRYANYSVRIDWDCDTGEMGISNSSFRRRKTDCWDENDDSSITISVTFIDNVTTVTDDVGCGSQSVRPIEIVTSGQDFQGYLWLGTYLTDESTSEKNNTIARFSNIEYTQYFTTFSLNGNTRDELWDSSILDKIRTVNSNGNTYLFLYDSETVTSSQDGSGYFEFNIPFKMKIGFVRPKNNGYMNETGVWAHWIALGTSGEYLDVDDGDSTDGKMMLLYDGERTHTRQLITGASDGIVWYDNSSVCSGLSEDSSNNNDNLWDEINIEIMIDIESIYVSDDNFCDEMIVAKHDLDSKQSSVSMGIIPNLNNRGGAIAFSYFEIYQLARYKSDYYDGTPSPTYSNNPEPENTDIESSIVKSSSMSGTWDILTWSVVGGCWALGICVMILSKNMHRIPFVSNKDIFANPNVWVIPSFVFSVSDMATDIFAAVERLDAGSESGIWYILGTAVPFLMQLAVVVWIIYQLRAQNGKIVSPKRFEPHYTKYIAWIGVLVMIGGPYATIDLCSSNLFMHIIFCAQLRSKEREYLKLFKFFNIVIFENIPQFVLNLWYLQEHEKNLWDIVLEHPLITYSMVSSLLSILWSSLQPIAISMIKVKQCGKGYEMHKTKLSIAMILSSCQSDVIKYNHQFASGRINKIIANCLQRDNGHVWAVHGQSWIEIESFESKYDALDKIVVFQYLLTWNHFFSDNMSTLVKSLSNVITQLPLDDQFVEKMEKSLNLSMENVKCEIQIDSHTTKVGESIIIVDLGNGKMKNDKGNDNIDIEIVQSPESPEPPQDATGLSSNALPQEYAYYHMEDDMKLPPQPRVPSCFNVNNNNNQNGVHGKWAGAVSASQIGPGVEQQAQNQDILNSFIEIFGMISPPPPTPPPPPQQQQQQEDMDDENDDMYGNEVVSVAGLSNNVYTMDLILLIDVAAMEPFANTMLILRESLPKLGKKYDVTKVIFVQEEGNESSLLWQAKVGKWLKDFENVSAAFVSKQDVKALVTEHNKAHIPIAHIVYIKIDEKGDDMRMDEIDEITLNGSNRNENGWKNMLQIIDGTVNFYQDYIKINTEITQPCLNLLFENNILPMNSRREMSFEAAIKQFNIFALFHNDNKGKIQTSKYSYNSFVVDFAKQQNVVATLLIFLKQEYTKGELMKILENGIAQGLMKDNVLIDYESNNSTETLYNECCHMYEDFRMCVLPYIALKMEK